MGLEQAKKRNHKIFITDMAIDKITPANIKCYSDEQNMLIDTKHRELLLKSQKLNDSNETAILFDINNSEEAFMFGTENSVNIFESPNANAMVNKNLKLFLAHNHPSVQNFSYADIGVFLMNDSINGISVVSNMGVVHILVKTNKYSFSKAYECISQIRKKYDVIDDVTNKLIVQDFIKTAKSLGIEYC